jgi:hypothetical protein
MLTTIKPLKISCNFYKYSKHGFISGHKNPIFITSESNTKGDKSVNTRIFGTRVTNQKPIPPKIRAFKISGKLITLETGLPPVFYLTLKH